LIVVVLRRWGARLVCALGAQHGAEDVDAASGQADEDGVSSAKSPCPRRRVQVASGTHVYQPGSQLRDNPYEAQVAMSRPLDPTGRRR